MTELSSHNCRPQFQLIGRAIFTGALCCDGHVISSQWKHQSTNLLLTKLMTLMKNKIDLIVAAVQDEMVGGYNIVHLNI